MEKTLKFEPNVETEVKLLCSGPIKQGENKYGEWWLFSVEYRGEKYSLFPDHELYTMIKNFPKNTQIKIKTITKDGKLLRWEVKDIKQMESQEQSPERIKTQNITSDNEYWEAKEDMKNYLIGIGQSWNWAAQLYPDETIEVISYEADRILFELSNHFGRAIRHLKTAKNKFHLKYIFNKYQKIWGRHLTKHEMNILIEKAKEIKTKFEEQEENEDINND